MSRSFVTFLGFSSSIAWIQAIDYLYLTRDTTIHNGSFVACVVFAITLLLYGLINRLVAIEPTRGFLLGISLTASLCGVLYMIAQGNEVRLALFCLQLACSTLLIVAWGQTLTLFAYRKLVVLVSAGGLCSAVLLLFCTLVLPDLALFATAALPCCSGIFLFLARGRTGDGDEGQDRARHTAQDGFFTFEPIEAETLRRLPWMFLLVLCLCTFAASLFGGLAINPYLVNSQTLMAAMLVLTAISIALIGAGSELFSRWQDRRGPKEESAGRDRPNNPDDAAGAHEIASFMQPIVGIVLILLIGGLMLFSMKLPGTMTMALSMVLAAKNCLVVVCWIVFPRVVADTRLPFTPCFALLILANGTLYASYLGAWINRSLGIDFNALTATATVLIAFVAVLALLYMVVRMKQLNAEQRTAVESGPPSFTLEDIRDALRAHQHKMMEPYGLTEREQQIIALIVDGQTLGGIAEELYITERTVKFHSKNAYDKLGVHNKKELMRMFSGI